MNARSASLLVEDREDFATELVAALEDRGLAIDWAPTWQEGLDLFRVNGYQLVVADYNLPDTEHGLKLLARAKELMPSVRLVLISGPYPGAERAIPEIGCSTPTTRRPIRTYRPPSPLTSKKRCAKQTRRPTGAALRPDSLRTSTATIPRSRRSINCCEPTSSAVADAVYLDANAPVHWAFGRAGSPEPGDVQAAASIDGLLAGDSSVCCSPFTLTEFTGVLWRAARSGNTTFDHAAASNALEEIMRHVSSGRVRTHNLHPRAFEIALSIVSAGSKEHGRAFSAPDAIHLHEACQWSRTIGRKVIVATCDSDFAGMLQVFPGASRYVDLWNVCEP